MSHFTPDRRAAERVDLDISINYQAISKADALNDPYSHNFAIPQFYLLRAHMEELELQYKKMSTVLDKLTPELGQIIDILNQKISLTNTAIYQAMVKALLPKPARINISETGLSLFSQQPISTGAHLHVTLTDPNQDVNICTIVKVVYAEEKPSEGYKIGAYFVSLHPADHKRIVHLVEQIKLQEVLKHQNEFTP